MAGRRWRRSGLGGAVVAALAIACLTPGVASAGERGGSGPKKGDTGLLSAWLSSRLPIHVHVSQGATGGDGSASSPHGTIASALADVAAYRAAGGKGRAFIHVGAGIYEEQVKIGPDMGNLSVEGSTRWNYDAVGRLDAASPVRANETRITFATVGDNPAVDGETDANGNPVDGKGTVMWLHADAVTVQDVVVEAQGWSVPPRPTGALHVDRCRGAVLRRVWVRGGFARILCRGSQALLDRTLTTIGPGIPAVGTNLSGGPENEGRGSRYVLDRCVSTGVGNGFEAQAHGNTFDPELIDPMGLESNVILFSRCLATNNVHRGFQLTAHLPNDRQPWGFLTDPLNEGRLIVRLDRCESRQNGKVGLGIQPDNFGFHNPGPSGPPAAPSTIAVSLRRTTLEDNGFAPAMAIGIDFFDDPDTTPGGDYVGVIVHDPDGSADSLLDPDNHRGWGAGSYVIYNGQVLVGGD